MRLKSQDSSASFGMTRWERLKNDKDKECLNATGSQDSSASFGMTRWERLKNDKEKERLNDKVGSV
jgi:predicted PP-loop superfamily ATPase